VVLGDALITGESFEQAESFVWTAVHGDGDGVVERDNGLSELDMSTSYSATSCGRSVASAVGASSWMAAIAA
jgi:hypothetical protein